MWPRLQTFMLRSLALLLVAGFAAVLAPATAQAAGGNGSIIVHLDPVREDVNVTARRQGNEAQPREVRFSINVSQGHSKAYYDSGEIPQTSGADNCTGSFGANNLFDVIVTEVGGRVVGSQYAVKVCGQPGQPNVPPTVVTIKVPPPGGGPTGDGVMRGKITSPDGKPAPNVTLALDNGDGTYEYRDITPLADGTYLLPSIKPGTYKARLEGRVGEAPNIESVSLVREGIKINAGENVVNFVVGSGDVDIKGEVDCNAGPALDWLICNPIRFALSIIDWVRENVLVPFLQEKPISPTGADPYSKSLLDVWSAMRNLANVLFIALFMLAIFGTAVGYDNYTVKKVLPRLVAAAIFIQLSFLLSAIIVDIGNVLGQGLAQLGNAIIQPPPKLDFTQSWSAKGIFLGGTLLGIAGAATALVTLSGAAIGGMLLAVVVVFFTLVFRKVLIILLVVISPLAFVLWVLPNTAKWFREWYQALIKVSLMYAMIMALFVAGRLFAKAAELSGNGGETAQALAPIFGLMGYVVPMLLVPLTFAAAGKLMQAGVGGVTALGQKLHNPESDRAQRRAEKRRQNNALIATGQKPTRLGGVGRAIAAKRGGFGWRPKGAALQSMHGVAQKSIQQQASADANRKMRQEMPRSFDDEAAARSSVMQAGMLEQRAAAGGARSMPGGGQVRHVEFSEEGAQKLANVVRQALAGRDQGLAIAAMQRMSQFEEGQTQLQALRQDTMGGTDHSVVANEHRTTWDMGTADADGVDFNKPPVAAFDDVSAAEFAQMSAPEVQRALDYYQRNASDPDAANAAAQFNRSAQAAMDPNGKLRSRMQPEVFRALADAASTHANVLHADTVAAAREQ